MADKMIKCKTCGEEIAYSAKTCPHCGAKNNAKPSFWMLVFVFFCIFTVIEMFTGDDLFASKPITASVGETIETGGAEITLLSVSKGVDEYGTLSEGNSYVVCEFEVVNNSNDSIDVYEMINFEAYCDSYSIDHTYNALSSSDNELNGEVAKGKRIKGCIGYEIPEDWEQLEIKYTPGTITGKDVIFTINHDEQGF